MEDRELMALLGETANGERADEPRAAEDENAQSSYDPQRTEWLMAGIGRPASSAWKHCWHEPTSAAAAWSMKRFLTSRSIGAVFTSARKRSVATLIAGFPASVSLVGRRAARRFASTSRRSRAVQRAVTARGHRLTLAEAVVVTDRLL